jgi:PAS domain S-box-containing protein
LERAETLSKTDFDLFPYDLAQSYAANDSSAYEGGAQQIEETAEHQSGERRIYLSAKVPLLDAAGAPYGLCGVSTDITDRKEAERALQESEQRFRTLAEAVPDMLFSATSDGRLTYLSQRFKHYTNLTSDEPEGNWQVIVHADDYSAFDQQWRKSTETGSPFERQCRISKRDSNYRWFVVRALPVRDEAGRVTKWLGACTDIDRIKRIEAALRRSNEELAQFAYAAAHDLQEPMRNICNSLGLLRRLHGARLDERANELMDQSVTSARRMISMMRDLLAYSNAVSEEEEQAPRADAGKVVRQVLADLHMSMRETGAEVKIGELPTLPVQKAHLAQLLQNLIGNALKYHRPGMTPKVEISAHRDGDRWQFAVSDNGIGFDPAYAERIFGVFRRLHTREQYPGSGIGLAICARIVAHYGGRIWAESVAGMGATFRFTLPAEALSL